MGRRRALLTDRERELLADEKAEDRRYQAVSRIRRKISEELPPDLTLLEDHHEGLLAELHETVGPVFYCPLCGDPFPTFGDVVGHMGREEAGHMLDPATIESIGPAWWQEHAHKGWDFSKMMEDR